MNTQPVERPLSVLIGRIVIRLIVVGIVIIGAKSAYGAYADRQRAKVIAPIQAYALEMMIALKNGDYFTAQEHLDPALHWKISVDWLSYFAQKAELNATRTGTWGEWNATRDGNASLYHLQGILAYTNAHTNPMSWDIFQSPQTIRIRKLTIGKWVLPPKKRSTFP